MAISTMATFANAQFDDLYYDPSRDQSVISTQTNPYTTSQNASASEYAGGGYYDDYGYSEYDDYDFSYANRIQRFHRPNTQVVFVNNGWNDPWFDPYYANTNVNIVIGGGWGWNRWNRWSSWNNWCGPGWNDPWGWNGFGGGWGGGFGGGWGWNNWNAGWGWNRWNNGWGWNQWHGGWGNTYIVNNYYGPNNGYTWNNGGRGNTPAPVTQYASRRGGSVGSNTAGRVNNGPRMTERGGGKYDDKMPDPNTTSPRSNVRHSDMSRGSVNPSGATRSPIYDRNSNVTRGNSGGVEKSPAPDVRSNARGNSPSPAPGSDVRRGNDSNRPSPAPSAEPSRRTTPSSSPSRGNNSSPSYESPRSSGGSMRSSPSPSSSGRSSGGGGGSSRSGGGGSRRGG